MDIAKENGATANDSDNVYVLRLDPSIYNTPQAKEQLYFRTYRRAIAQYQADPCPETHSVMTYASIRWRDAYNEYLYASGGAYES